MSLVCYGSSDSDDDSEEYNFIPESDESTEVSESEESEVLQTDEKNISTFEEQNINETKERNIPAIDFIPKLSAKKERETVKISIPSLNQFKDDDMKMESKAKPTIKSGSGLLSMLPPPKYSGSTTQRGLTPHVLTKQKNAEKKAPEIKFEPKKSSSSESVKPVLVPQVKHSAENIFTNNDEEGDDTASFDFFSLESVNKKTENEENSALGTQLPSSGSKSSLFSSLPEPTQSASHSVIPVYQEEATSAPFTSALNENYSEDYEWNKNDQSTHNSDQAGGSENYQSVENISQSDAEMRLLKDENFKKMLGKKKEEIQIIDINADDQLTGKEQWLMQSLTEEKIHKPSKRKGEMPTQQQKRKHQITYLAFQAKERELDLKNQWSSNRRTRRETQAKYGF